MSASVAPLSQRDMFSLLAEGIAEDLTNEESLARAASEIRHWVNTVVLIDLSETPVDIQADDLNVVTQLLERLRLQARLFESRGNRVVIGAPKYLQSNQEFRRALTAACGSRLYHALMPRPGRLPARDPVVVDLRQGGDPRQESDLEGVIDAFDKLNSNALSVATRTWMARVSKGRVRSTPERLLVDLARNLSTDGFLEPAYRVELLARTRLSKIPELPLEGTVEPRPKLGIASEIVGKVDDLRLVPTLSPKILMFGAAGGGKTTILRQIEKMLSVQPLAVEGRHYPVWLPVILEINADGTLDVARSFLKEAIIEAPDAGDLPADLPVHFMLASLVDGNNIRYFFASSLLFLIDDADRVNWAKSDDKESLGPVVALLSGGAAHDHRLRSNPMSSIACG